MPEQTTCLRLAYAAALLVILCVVVASPPAAQAQLPGSVVVTITSPSSGSTVSGTTTISANVSIIGWLTVAGVQFKLDGANLGAEDTSAPYAVSWNTTTAANGSHTLTAVARDVLGQRFTSNPVTVTVFNDKTLPTVSITSPSSGTTVGGTVTVSATASDNIGVAGVQFRLGGANLGAEDTAAPYAVSWNTTTAGNGSHSLTAVARDAAGNRTTSAPVTVTVLNDTSAPTVNITSHSSGATVGGTVTVSATASDNVGVTGVQFKLDGANLGAEDTAAPYSVSWNTTTAGNGSHSLTAVARDAAGNRTTSAPVTVTVLNDTSAPTVSITSPSSGATVGGIIAVSAAASDNVGVAGVQFKLDGANLGGEDTSAPYSVSWNTTTASNGSHSLTTVARDAAGNRTTSAPVTVTVLNDTSAPTVSITSPVSGATVSGTVTVSASASDNVAVAGVQFFIDGAAFGSEDTTAPYSVDWDTSAVANGSYSLTARARDTAGNSAASPPVTVTVSNGPPAATRFEDTELSVTYTPNWIHGSTARAWSTGTATLSEVAGMRATFSFAGTSVGWVGFRGPQTGIAHVFLDGAMVAAVDTYSAMEEVQAVVFRATNLAAGSHTLTIEVTGLKNAASTSSLIVVDAFEVMPSVPLPTAGTRFEETGPSVAYTPGWTQGDRTSTWSGGTAAVSTTAGARTTFTFTGTSVRWIGFRGPQAGLARVSLDGIFVTDVDTYAPDRLQAVVFSTTQLPLGSHTLTIEVIGTRNPASTGSLVVVDAFDIRSRFEETHPSIAYSGTWEVTVSRPWSDRTAVFTWEAGARATFTFTGTSVNWVGLRGPQAGIARVFLDGTMVAEVDTYSATEEVQAVIFSAVGLAPGTHMLTIEVTGTKNPASLQPFIAIDAFDINF
jgi:hypothetical protein